MELFSELLLNLGLVFFFVFAIAIFLALKERQD